MIAGKFGALFASIPFALFAAVYCVLFGYVGTYFQMSLYLAISPDFF